MSASGMEIASHSWNHADLTKVRDNVLKKEVEVSKLELERIIGTEVSSFAYPYGLFEDRTIEALKKAGYTKACTTKTGWLGSDADPFRIRRVAIFNHDTLSSFARKIAFADTEVSWKDIAGYMKRRLAARCKSQRFRK